MNDSTNSTPDAGLTRRELLMNSGRIAAAGALAGIALPQFVHAQGADAIQLALVGCGGRGTGAVEDAFLNKSGPTKLVAMADVFPNRLVDSYGQLKPKYEVQVDVAEDRKYIGFDAYKQAMDCLKPGDVVILTTPPAFRWVHFTYAIQKGLNVFMEKPISVDGPSTRRMLELGKEAAKKNLKVAVGLMCRHCEVRGELFKRIKNGEIGDLTMLRAYRMAGPTGNADVKPKPDDISELMYQIKNFHGFLWASGGAYSDFLIHNIDECCWMKDDFPIEAKASGGRHFRGDFIDQNFDHYSTEFTFADGSKIFLEGRTIAGCQQEFASYAHGTKGSAVISSAGHLPSRARIFKGQSASFYPSGKVRDDVVWQGPANEPNPYRLEWNDFIDAVRSNKTYSEVERGAKASLVTAMGRMAAHTGKIVTYDEMLNHEHELGAGLDKLKMDSPAPVQLLANGKYPVPQPGITNVKREYVTG